MAAASEDIIQQKLADVVLDDHLKPNTKPNTVNGASKSATEPASKQKAPCILVLGMAGSGKTTFVQVRFVPNVYLLTVIYSHLFKKYQN